MYWLQPPQHLRRAAAVLLVLGALAWDLHTGATAPYPVAARPIPAGSAVSADDVAWVDLPVSRLPTPDLAMATAAVAIAAGEPLTAALLTRSITAPEGWWTLPLAVGTLAVPGDEALLVVADPPLTARGVVVTAQIGDPYDLDHRPAAVAVPPESAAIVAAAAQAGLLVTAIRPAGGGR